MQDKKREELISQTVLYFSPSTGTDEYSFGFFAWTLYKDKKIQPMQSAKFFPFIN